VFNNARETTTMQQHATAADQTLAGTVNEAVRRGGIPKTNLYAYMLDGSLPFYHVGRHRLILMTDLRALIVSRPGVARKAHRSTSEAA
jgi:excisionase family DNA binding protein